MKKIIIIIILIITIFISYNLIDNNMINEEKNITNNEVIQYAESLGYIIVDDKDQYYIMFNQPGNEDEEAVYYHRSEHTVFTLNWASNEIKADAQLIEKFALGKIK
jgi:hypothetical protein